MKNFDASRPGKEFVPISLILPTLWLLVQLYGCYFTRLYNFSVDPEYAYFASGLNLANLNIHLNHIDHPGTPLQVLIALVMRIVHLFSFSGNSLTIDALANPEKYLLITGIIIAFSSFWVTYRLSSSIYRISGRLSDALIFQLIPLSFSLGFRVTPEKLSYIVSMLLFYMIYRIIITGTWKKHDVLKLALLIGLAASIKITMGFMAIIPFLLFNQFRQKLIFTSISIVSFFIFAFPVLFQIVRFYRWIRDLFLHSGTYGQGEKSIVQLTDFRNYALQIIDGSWYFVISFMVFATILIMIKMQKKKLPIFDNQSRLMTGILISLLLFFLFVSKHFGMKYMLPALNVCTYGWIFVFWFLEERIQQTFVKKIAVFFPFLLLITFIPHILSDYSPLAKNEKVATQTREYLGKRPNSENLLIYTEYSGCAHKAYALHFANIFSGSDKKHFSESLKTLYPGIFFWENRPEGTYSDFAQTQYSLFEVLQKTTWLYSSLSEKTGVNNLLKQINSFNSETDTLFRIAKLFENKSNQDIIYKITPTHKVQKLFGKETEINCDFETLTPDQAYFLSNYPQFSFKKSDNRTGEKSLSGKYSYKMLGEYGLDLALGKLNKGDEIEISLWQKAEKDDITIVISAKDSKQFYAAGSQVGETNPDSWKKITFQTSLPLDKDSPELSFYIWNPGKTLTYIDDIKLTIKKRHQIK